MTGIFRSQRRTRISRGRICMKVSITELTSLYKQALEGCGMDNGVYERAAGMAVWAHTHGMNIFCDFDESLSQCEQLRRADIRILAQDTQFIHFDVGQDGRETSALLWGNLVSDLIAARAFEDGLCAAQVDNCGDRLLLIKGLVDCQRLGLSCLAVGRHSIDSEVTYVVRTHAERCCPEIRQYQSSPATQSGGLSGMLVYARDEQLLDDYIHAHYAFDDSQMIDRASPEQLKKTYQQSLQDGVELPEELHKTLVSLAANVLVESSEQSRMGAGA